MLAVENMVCDRCDVTPACVQAALRYSTDMSANDLLERVKTLPPRELRKFLIGIRELEEDLGARHRSSRRKPVRWPDAVARRRRIFGEKVLPNLVLLAREEERF